LEIAVNMSLNNVCLVNFL